jgi:hypothetical protein
VHQSSTAQAGCHDDECCHTHTTHTQHTHMLGADKQAFTTFMHAGRYPHIQAAALTDFPIDFPTDTPTDVPPPPRAHRLYPVHASQAGRYPEPSAIPSRYPLPSACSLSATPGLLATHRGRLPLVKPGRSGACGFIPKCVHFRVPMQIHAVKPARQRGRRQRAAKRKAEIRSRIRRQMSVST